MKYYQTLSRSEFLAVAQNVFDQQSRKGYTPTGAAIVLIDSRPNHREDDDSAVLTLCGSMRSEEMYKAGDFLINQAMAEADEDQLIPTDKEL